MLLTFLAMQNFTLVNVLSNFTSTVTISTTLMNETSNVPLLHEYFRNSYYKNFIALSLILFFSIVFNLIYLIIDSLLDKQKHYNHALRLSQSYTAAKKHQNEQNQNDTEQNYEIDKKNQDKSNFHIEYAVWSYRNLQISFIHSSLCSVWLIKILSTQAYPLFSDLLYYHSWDTYLIIAFSCGYFLYDLYDIYANGYQKVEWVIICHHIIVLVSFGYNMSHFISIGYTVCALLMEFNSVFLHARKLLKFYGFKNTDLIVKLTKLLNLLTFVMFRFGILGLLYYAIYNDGSRVSIVYLLFLTTCIGLMSIINVVLFKRLLVKDVLSLCKKPKSMHQEQEVITSSNEDAQMKLIDNFDLNNV